MITLLGRVVLSITHPGLMRTSSNQTPAPGGHEVQLYLALATHCTAHRAGPAVTQAQGPGAAHQ